MREIKEGVIKDLILEGYHKIKSEGRRASIKELAEYSGANKCYVSRILSQEGINLQKENMITAEEKAMVIQLGKAGRTVGAITKIVHRGTNTVKDILLAEGIIEPNYSYDFDEFHHMHTATKVRRTWKATELVKVGDRFMWDITLMPNPDGSPCFGIECPGSAEVPEWKQRLIKKGRYFDGIKETSGLALR